MKRTLALVTAAFMVSTALPAFAQTEYPSTQDPAAGGGAQMDTETDAEAGAGADMDTDADAGVDPGTTAATGTEANFGSVVSAIQSGNMETDFTSVTDEANVNVVRVDSLTGAAEEPQALENALSENQTQIDEMRTALEGNEAVKAKLEAEGLQASNVVATEMRGDSMLTVYVQ